VTRAPADHKMGFLALHMTTWNVQRAFLSGGIQHAEEVICHVNQACQIDFISIS